MCGEPRRDLGEHPLGRLDEVVLAHEPQVGEHAAGELFELELDEPTVEAELDDVALDLLGDAAHHLRALEHGDDVADRHEVFDLERRERAGHAVEARLVATEDLQRLVGAGEHARDRDRASACCPGSAPTRHPSPRRR